MKKARLILIVFFTLNAIGCIVSTYYGEQNKKYHYIHLQAVAEYNNNYILER